MIRQIFRQAEQPQPVEKLDRKGWVKWGENNLYAQYLIGLFYDNPIHGGIVNQKIKFITSGGIQSTNDSALSNGMGTYDYGEIVNMITQDFEIFNGFSILYKKELGTGFWQAQPVDFELFRATEDGIYIAYSDDWSKANQNEKTGYKKIKSIFHVTEDDTECMFYNIERPKQRGFLKTKDLTSNYYPFPTYAGALTSIMAGIEMDFFTYSEVVNGYKGGTVITLLNGIPDSIQEENKIIERVKGEATDRDTQGGLTVLFADGKDRAPEVSQMNGNDLDKRYVESDKNILKKIMIAHGVISPALFGVMSDSMFGSKEEMEIAYKLFQENYVKSRQKNITESLNWAFKKLNKEELNISFKDYILTLDQNIEETNIVSAALNGMSPLVANKVIESLTINEIRGLGKLPPIPEGDLIPTSSPTTFGSEDTSLKIIDLFTKVGVKRGEVTIIDSREYTSFDDDESDYKQSFLSNRFEITLTDDDRNILQMVKNGESYDSISKAIGKGGVFLSKRLMLLSDNGYLDKWNVTEKGSRASATLSDIEVMYSYELRPNAPDLLLGGSSRPFCEKLIQLDKLYTRQEINTITNAVGRDVWTYRGGWYHNPDSDKNTPSCRHIWKQNIITS